MIFLNHKIFILNKNMDFYLKNGLKNYYIIYNNNEYFYNK